DWSKKNEEYRECESETSKERKRKFKSEEENNQTWRAGSYRQGKKVSKRAEFTDQKNRKQYSRKSSAESYGTIIRRRKSKELQNNRSQVRDCTRDNIWMKLKELERTIKGLQSTANLRFFVQNKNTETDTAQHNMDEEINLFLEEQRNIFRTTLRGKNKEIIAESSKKVLSKEDWKETDKLEFNLTVKKINLDLQLEIQQAEDIWTEDTLVDLKGWWKIMKERNSKEIKNAMNKEI
ncbi:21606_t:CDS:2, partial [Gigaspora margarita]